MKLIALCAALLLGLPAAGVAAAEFSIEDFLKEADTPDARLVARVAGLSLSRANARLVVDRKDPFFCPPPDHVISIDEYIETLRDYISQHDVFSSDAADTIPLHMLSSLIEKYPCSK